MSFRPLAVALATTLVGVSLSDAASAFCRQKTCDANDCLIDSSGCVAEGDDLFYSVPCLSFAIDEGSAEPLGLSDGQMEDIVTSAFDAWASVECPGGGNPNFEIESVGTVPAGGIFFCEQETLNASVWTLDSTWNYESTSLGYTTSTFVVGTGEVYDADVELNLSRIAAFDHAGEEEVIQAVLSIATHEAGHFLGLAHSNDNQAVMAKSYSNLSPRPLTEDDIAGICTLYPPDGERLDCSTPGVTEAAYDEDACTEVVEMEEEEEANSGCSMGPVERSTALGSFAWLPMGGLFALGWRRGRQRSRRDSMVSKA